MSSLTTLSRYKLYLALAGDGDTDTADTEPSCEEECPEGAHCSWGVCFCDAGQYQAQLSNISFYNIIMYLDIAVDSLEVGSGTVSEEMEEEEEKGPSKLRHCYCWNTDISFDSVSRI